jgi:hypothetical protein
LITNACKELQLILVTADIKDNILLTADTICDILVTVDAKYDILVTAGTKDDILVIKNQYLASSLIVTNVRAI